MRRRRLLLGAAAAAVPSLARAQTLRDELRVSWSDGLDHLDPYRTPLRTGLALMQELWDGLLWRDPDTLELRPLLATFWHAPDPLTWDFRLRRGVWFHDGSPFGPADVVATVRRVCRDGGLGIPANYAFLRDAEALDDGRVRLHLAHPFPAALDFIASVLPILPRDAAPERAIGTGPWRLDAFDPHTRAIALVRHESYWPGSPKGRTRVRRLGINQPDDPAAPFSDLISGRVDWIWQLTPDEFDAIQTAAELRALRADSMRVAYLALDAAGRSDADGPLTLLPVRQAVCHAIDRARLASLAAPGGARLIDTPCLPTQWGCDAAAAVRYRLDRMRAHELLANAGLPDGFATTLVTYARPELAEAVAHDLTKIGIRTALRLLQPAAAMAEAAAGRAPLFLGSWGSASINDIAAFLTEFFGGGAMDCAGLPGLAALVDRAGQEADADQRRALCTQAIAQITNAACWLPLFVDAASYGIQRSLSFQPTPDELPRFYRIGWRNPT